MKAILLATAATFALGVTFFSATATPAQAKGCGGYVNVAVWGCAPWDNNPPKAGVTPGYKAPPPPPAANLINNNGGRLIGQDGGSIVSRDGAGAVSKNNNSLVGNAGGTLVGNAGGTLTNNPGGMMRSK